MGFNVGDIVKKTAEPAQKYQVAEVQPEDKYLCKYYPSIGSIKFVFNGSDLELA